MTVVQLIMLLQSDKFSGLAKGFAYIEFLDKESVRTLLASDDFHLEGNRSK